MPIYDGVVTVAEDDIPVIVEMNDDVVRLSASGTEIGEWAKEECEIYHVANSTYSIRAEDETLSFVPNQPSLFAAAVNGGVPDTKSSAAVAPTTDPNPSPSDGIPEAPPPKPLTMGVFYALCALTAALAVWSIVSLIL